MPISKLETEKREVKIIREIPVLRVTLSPLEVCSLVLDYVKKTEVTRLGLGDTGDTDSSVEMLIDRRTKKFQGCKIEVYFDAQS
jgi:hypothetical protein